jgi:hypothetical protein
MMQIAYHVASCASGRCVRRPVGLDRIGSGDRLSTATCGFASDTQGRSFRFSSREPSSTGRPRICLRARRSRTARSPFEARVLGPPDFDDHRGADFWPQERTTGEAGYIDGRLCAAPCLDPRFVYIPG